MWLTRREFLIAAGICCASTARGSGFPRVIHAGGKKSEPLERTALTLCRQCPGGCGLRIRVVDECVVGIAGNPNHPVNRGGVCARAPATVQSLYNPDRLTRPLELAGPKGSGRYRPVDWDVALDRLAARLASVRRSPGAHTLAVLVHGDRGLRRILWSRFLQAYGSNNLIDSASPGGLGASPAVTAQQGFGGRIGYDFERTQYVLSFGSQWLDAHWSPAQASAAFAALRSRRQLSRPKVVHFEPRLSLTGAKANEWIPLLPGTEGALALGLAHVLLREGLFDREFVETYTHGFEDPRGHGEETLGYRRLVLRDYPPSRVAQITGVDEGTIYRIAREFAANRPALAIGFDGCGVSTQRSYDRMAIHALNALAGSIDVPGGVTHSQDLELLSLPLLEPDALAANGLSKPRLDSQDLEAFPLGGDAAHLLAERFLVRLPYAIDTLVLAGADPVFLSSEPEKVKQALASIPFVVSLSPWMDESTRWADLVLPEAHFLQRWDLDIGQTLSGRPTVTIGQPAIEATDGAGRDSAEWILQLARKIGGPVASALPFAKPEQVVRACSDTLFEKGRGGPFGSPEDADWTRLLETSGWRFAAASSADDFYRQILAAGGWTDPIYPYRAWERVLRNPVRKFAFHSTVIAERVKPATGADHLRCLPHHEEVQEGEQNEAFPLRLYVYPLPTLAGLSEANVPWLLDICGSYMSARWESWVELNPETARRLGIENDDLVTVTSARGRVTVRARVFPGIMPDVVAMPWGLGHESGGRWCEGIGENPATIVQTRTDPLTSAKLWIGSRVSIKKA